MASPGAAQEPEQAPIPMISDTPQYCIQLAQQIDQGHSKVPDVVRLLSEGRDLCDQGEVRSGIRRLRRALVILHRKRERSIPPPPGDSGHDPGHDKPLEPLPY